MRSARHVGQIVNSDQNFRCLNSKTFKTNWDLKGVWAKLWFPIKTQFAWIPKPFDKIEMWKPCGSVCDFWSKLTLHEFEKHGKRLRVGRRVSQVISPNQKPSFHEFQNQWRKLKSERCVSQNVISDQNTLRNKKKLKKWDLKGVWAKLWFLIKTKFAWSAACLTACLDFSTEAKHAVKHAPLECLHEFRKNLKKFVWGFQCRLFQLWGSPSLSGSLWVPLYALQLSESLRVELGMAIERVERASSYYYIYIYIYIYICSTLRCMLAVATAKFASTSQLASSSVPHDGAWAAPTSGQSNLPFCKGCNAIRIV